MTNYPNNGIAQNQFYGIPNIQPNQFAFNPPVRPMLPGRMVNSLEEIMPNEVPMDGSVGVFVKNDLSCMYSKAWNSDGTIRTIKFVPYEEETANAANNTNEEILNTILNELNAIKKMIPNYNRTTYHKQQRVDKEG